MGKGGKIYLSIVFILFIGFLWVMVQTFKPVRNVQPDDVMKITGTVVNISEGPGHDIVIYLKNDNHYYYINRGLKNGLSIENLHNKTHNKSVILYTINRWTIFTRDGNMGHISKLMINDQVIYNEINNDEHAKTK